MTVETATQMSEQEARRLTERIRSALDRVSTAWSDLAERVGEAYERRADLALGYASWGEYAEAELCPPSQLAAEVRRELVGLLSARGMSTRAIAPVVNVTHKTVVLDRQVVPEVPPEDRTDWTPEDRAEQDDLDATDDLIDFATGEIVTDLRDGTVPPSSSIDVEEQEPGPQQPPAPRPATVVGLDGKTYSRPEPNPARVSRRRPITDQARDAGWDLRRAVERIQRIAQDDRFTPNREQVASHLRSHLSFAIEVCQDLLDRTTNN